MTIGRAIDQDLVILKGIEQGETVVTEGQLRLAPGSLVSIAIERSGGGAGGVKARQRPRHEAGQAADKG